MSISVRVASLFAALLTLLVLFWPSFASMVSIWWRSETFTHGFLVLPITGFLIWRKRRGLLVLPFNADWRALPFVAVDGFVWLFARLADVLVVEQLAGVAMIPILVWLVLGLQAVRYLAFPLGFLVFLVPMGEELVDPLMHFTAMFTVSLLQLSGIPVYWQSTFFSIPSGDWSVVAACSGIRYLIASVFLGVLFAYLNYRSFWRRAAFVLLSFVVPVLANGVRAYLIVMIGHLSDMQMATGIDHLVYGWLFFGFVMLVLFAVGNLWSDQGPWLSDWDNVKLLAASESNITDSSVREVPIIAAGFLLLLLWPVIIVGIDARGVLDAEARRFEMPVSVAGWEPLPGDLAQWSPRYIGALAEHRQDYRRAADQVGLFLAIYGRGEGELVNSQNVLVPEKDPVWRMLEQTRLPVYLNDRASTVNESRLESSNQELLVWSWYWVNGHNTAKPHVAKLYEVLTLMTGETLNESAIILYTQLGLEPDLARERLRIFADEVLPSIYDRLGMLDPVSH